MLVDCKKNIEVTNTDYSLFHCFFDKFSKSEIEGIATDDPLLRELEESIEENKQFFYIADIILCDIQYVSKNMFPMLGVEPENVSLGYFLTKTHPEDLNRHHLAQVKIICVAQELYIQKKGHRVLSINVRARKPDGTYFNALYQAFLFYSKVPYESVFLIFVITDISESKKLHKGFHFYNGEDCSQFRYPDDKLLMTGCIFSHTEFRIIQLIEEGLSSQEIADKLFRSVYTVSTHRTNILQKSGKFSLTEVILHLKKIGLL
jgi:DNA-binding CsgD family transcriptional regulator